jgi:hypothetical protein
MAATARVEVRSATRWVREGAPRDPRRARTTEHGSAGTRWEWSLMTPSLGGSYLTRWSLRQPGVLPSR